MIMRKNIIKIYFFQATFWALLTLLAAGWPIPVTSSHAAEQASLQGMITDAQTKLPITGVEIVAGVPGGTPTYATRTDSFGMFRIDGMEPGTYNLEARHPGYHSGSDTGFAVASTGRNRWLKELTLKETFIDLFVEVGCVTTGMKLKNIPVRLTIVPTAGGGNMEVTGKTDEPGTVHFPGRPKGF